MNNKRYKTTMGTIVSLMALSGGLFAYQNIYLVKKAEANKEVIYVAKEDIQAHTVIKADMFQPIQVHRDSVLPGYVTNLNSVVGKELKGGLLKGEPLTNQRLEKKGSYKEGELLLNIVPNPESVGIKQNDHIRVYVAITDRITDETSIHEIFSNKQIKNVIGSDGLNLNSGQNKSQLLQIKASDKEVEKFLLAESVGKIKVVKIDQVDDGNIVSGKSIKEFDPNSDEVKNAIKNNQNEDEGQAVITYTVKEGDTLDSLALKFKTKPDTIRVLNNGREEFKAGEMIQVPAN